MHFERSPVWWISNTVAAGRKGPGPVLKQTVCAKSALHEAARKISQHEASAVK